MSASLTLTSSNLQTMLSSLPCAAVVVTYQETTPVIESANDTFTDYFTTKETCTGDEWNDTISSSLHGEFDELHMVASDGDPFETTLETSHNGETHYFDVSATPDTDDTGTPYAIITFEDTTPTDSEAQQYKAQLEEAEAELQQLAYVVSHDLKEPIRMITSYLDLLEMELDDLDDETEEYIDYAVDGANRMQTLLEDLLEYSRAKTHEQAHEPTDLNECVENAELALYDIIEATDATIDTDELPTLPVEPAQSETLFQYLLENSIQYTADDTTPEITILVDEHETEYEFTIEDNGIGIPDDQHDRVFEVFTRGPDADDYADGEGIGLAICSRIVDNHDGDIDIVSTDESGTTIRFTLSNENSNPSE